MSFEFCFRQQFNQCQNKVPTKVRKNLLPPKICPRVQRTHVLRSGILRNPTFPPQTASSISMAQDRRENVKTEDDSTGTNFFARGNVPLLPNPRLQFLSPVANGNDQLQRLCLCLGILSITFYLDPSMSTPLHRKSCSNTSSPNNNMC